MISLQEISVKSGKRTELIDITSEVQKLVSKAKIREGLCLVYCPHTTAGILINENSDPNVQKDILDFLSKFIPFKANYAHAEGNSDAHIKSALVGNNQTLIVSGGRLQLGSWGGIFFAEFDGPRNRQILVQLIRQ